MDAFLNSFQLGHSGHTKFEASHDFHTEDTGMEFFEKDAFPVAQYYFKQPQALE